MFKISDSDILKPSKSVLLFQERKVGWVNTINVNTETSILFS